MFLLIYALETFSHLSRIQGNKNIKKNFFFKNSTMDDLVPPLV